ncbi:uncharacterized protein KGF55_002237 [Candida pseudojiufengensis]|uniref:uncharacterized protein n=1 Tax=Candida pseudojiufengensis TaxID=497109 RepID=UPI00222498B4|nr:uncharacterized protein KGF55_002237 [Candida pseudojiufengensis]KAI5964295.1 hypothetical protein KGF55_002237 [Candida pseudojiufengensis]
MIDKEAKYDRQLRLWETIGQSKLENSHICLINATSTGSEILKNLILPEIGEFTIIDNRNITKEISSSNFFIRNNDIGKNVALCVTKNLNELNSDVKGYSINESIDSLLEKSEFWNQFNCVIISDYIPNLQQLINLLWSKQIPILIVNTIGFYASLNLLSNETTVIETHDPSRLYDLRIDQPWEELQEFSDSFDLEKMDDQEHSHIPYIVIFIKALQYWKKTYGKNPSTYNEKKLFKSYIESLSRNINLETNFIEALQSCHRAFQKTEIPESIKNLITNNNVNKDSTIFWIYIAALSKFIEKYNVLPLPGNLPDMASNSENYTKLSKIYKSKAEKDQELFTNEVYEICKEIGKSTEFINKESIKSFCKNTQLLFVTIGSKDLINSKLINQSNNEFISIYLSILTFNSYIDKYNEKPNITDLEKFIELFKELSSEISESTLNIIKEILNHNTRDYHNISSFMGGIVSQEILKLTTAQYIPLDNLFIFDGIKSSSERFKI